MNTKMIASPDTHSEYTPTSLVPASSFLFLLLFFAYGGTVVTVFPVTWSISCIPGQFLAVVRYGGRRYAGKKLPCGTLSRNRETRLG